MLMQPVRQIRPIGCISIVLYDFYSIRRSFQITAVVQFLVSASFFVSRYRQY